MLLAGGLQGAALGVVLRRANSVREASCTRLWDEMQHWLQQLAEDGGERSIAQAQETTQTPETLRDSAWGRCRATSELSAC